MLNSRIFVAGHRGLVGSAILRNLAGRGARNIITRSRDQLDLCDQQAVVRFFQRERPEYVFLAAAKVGGIMANSSEPALFIHDNLLIQTNVIDAAWRYGARKLLFLGSSCIYPKFAPQPIREECLLTGELEPTNDAYALAKIAGIRMCQAYRQQYGFAAISLMPTNLYGPGDNFDLTTSHVLPALLAKFHTAKTSGAREVVLWGTGTPRREFLHVDDLADASVFLMQTYDSPEIVNVGVGKDLEIRELAELIRDVVGCKAEIVYDRSKPDGTPRKLLDVSRLTNLGWTARIPLREGVEQTYRAFVEHAALPLHATASGNGMRARSSPTRLTQSA
jgi:GDP-L-fucose synthase